MINYKSKEEEVEKEGCFGENVCLYCITFGSFWEKFGGWFGFGFGSVGDLHFSFWRITLLFILFVFFGWVWRVYIYVHSLQLFFGYALAYLHTYSLQLHTYYQAQHCCLLCLQ